jgi:hypothetical protein
MKAFTDQSKLEILTFWNKAMGLSTISSKIIENVTEIFYFIPNVLMQDNGYRKSFFSKNRLRP